MGKKKGHLGKTDKGMQRKGREIKTTQALAPKRLFGTLTTGMAFYKRVPFDIYWNDFFASRKPDGSLLYPTVWNFIKTKTDDAQERTWMWQAVGPKPVIDERKKRGVPHLGDWQKQRALMLTVDNPEIKKMEEVLKERLDGIEAGRGVAHVVLKLVGNYMRYDDRIDQVFGGDPVLDELDADANQRRADIFFGLKRKTTDRIMRFLDMYLKCHGISQDDVSVLANAAAAGANAALRGAVVGGVLKETTESPVLQLMMKSFKEKADTFRMPLPDGDVVDVEAEVEKEVPVKKHGGSNGHG